MGSGQGADLGGWGRRERSREYRYLTARLQTQTSCARSYWSVRSVDVFGHSAPLKLYLGIDCETCCGNICLHDVLRSEDLFWFVRLWLMWPITMADNKVTKGEGNATPELL